MNELWKPVVGYEGIYEVSNMGNVRTVEGKTTSSKRFEKRVWKQRVMRQKIVKNKRGRSDARIDLWKGKEHKTFLVARLVAFAWCNGYQDGYTVNHINGNSLDNRAENLEWVTKAENIKLGFETGLYNSFMKSITLVNTMSGEIFCFKSRADACRWLGKNHSYIDCATKRGYAIRDRRGNVYKVA